MKQLKLTKSLEKTIWGLKDKKCFTTLLPNSSYSVLNQE